MSLYSYGSQDIYINDKNKNFSNGNPYYKNLANPNKKIYAAGNRHGRNKKKEKEAQQLKFEKSNNIENKVIKQYNSYREPAINTKHYLRLQQYTKNQWDSNISQEQLDDELAFRISQGKKYEMLCTLANANIKLLDLIKRLPARALNTSPESDNASICCISYDPICENDAYTMCTRCRAVCSWQVLCIWLKNSSSCPVCRLDMSECDILDISYRNCKL